MEKAMRIPWLRRNFLARRRLDRIFLDPLDAVHRYFTGRGHWPPYSLRAFVGDIRHFADAGRWFREDLESLEMLPPGCRILDLGCGCGRLAYELATNDALTSQVIQYEGLDVDAECILWCQRHITPLNPNFRFHHVDAANTSYNPHGALKASRVHFPYPPNYFDLILATSLFTHLLPDDCAHYLAEAARVLVPGGAMYLSFFLLNGSETARHAVEFPHRFEEYAVNRTDHPANAVAYEECGLLQRIEALDLKLFAPVRYGSQDVLLLRKKHASAVQVVPM
jgi:SAM-dependent methyltransferase